MTLKNSQVLRLHNYLMSLYQDKINELEAETINTIKASEEYKKTFTLITDFLINIDYPKDEIKDRAHIILDAKFELYDTKYNTWQHRHTIELKLDAILATLPDSLNFEEIVKLVDEKLGFEDIMNSNN